jgi:signal transduction histidine kinase
VAGVAHEVNTPLGVALAASTQIADEVGRLDGVIASGQLRRTSLTDFMATLHELAELLARNCARASTLIQSFKAVAADRGSDERRRFDLRAYVEDVTKSVEPTLNRSHVKLVIAKGIEGAAPLTIDSYPGVLSQVIINLVTNALTHAFEPEQAGVITIRIALRDAAHAELTVRDDGKGIPPDVLPKIFDPFFTTRRGAGGTGLGLHIVHNLVTGPLGGSISVETAPASGTAFIVVIPLNAPSEPV